MMHCGFIAMEPHTGEVKAWVGDVDYDTWQYDNVRAAHQPGSTFKLFVYSAALKKGLQVCQQFEDSPLTTPLMDNDAKTGESKLWEPKNASGRFSYENMTMRAAFARSNNIIAVKVGNDERVGVKSVAQTAHAMGIKSDLKETPSLCLGASDVNLLELVNSYGTVVNEGQPKTPVLVTKIIKKGEEKPIFESKRDIKDPSQSGSLDESQAYSMRRMLEAVCSDAGGTGQALNQYVSGVGIGGKTGTSNNYADAWFVAITPNLVCGAWVGGQYRQIHFRTAQGQGSRAALPIVGLFLKKVMGDKDFAKYRKKFTPKPELDRVIMACSNTVGPSTNVDSIQHDPYEPYSDSLPYTNSADGTTKSMQEIASEDINGLNGNTGSNNTGAEKPEEKSTESPASRVERAFENRSNP